MAHIVETKERVRYAETDRMGYFHHSNYLILFEIGRTEWLRSVGFSYRQLEDEGIIMPVSSVNLEYKKPAFYDEELVVKTFLKDVPGVRITFISEVYHVDDNELICTGEVTLAFVNADQNRPCRVPGFLESKLRDYI
jgi:acyl-CoA thioester hydrolase